MPSATLTKPQTPTQRQRLTERVGGVGGNVDRASGVIRNVAVIGTQSGNGRTYTEAALRRAVPMYEGAPVYFDHESEGARDRPSRDLFGELRNVRFDNGKVRADLHFLKSHPSAEQVCEAAERMPNRFGLSHHADGVVNRKGGAAVVESIDAVHSVDIVSKPATNKGLFESIPSESDLQPQDQEMQLSPEEQELITIYHADIKPAEKLARLSKLIGAEAATPKPADGVQESRKRLPEGRINFFAGLGHPAPARRLTESRSADRRINFKAAIAR